LPIEREDIRKILMGLTPPQPDPWAAVLELWKLASEWRYPWQLKNLNIHPVRGRSILYSAKNIVRLGEKKLLQSEEDWDFLARYLLVMDVNWLRYLADQKRISEETRNTVLAEKVVAADQILVGTDLEKASNVDLIIEQVAATFFEQPQPLLEDCIHITQIASKLNAKIGNSFKFYTRDNKLRSSNETVLYDETGLLEEFIPTKLLDQTLLHSNYFRVFASCSREEWSSWLRSRNAGIRTFMPINKTVKSFFNRQTVENEIKSRGYVGRFDYPYVTSHYELEDWDFPPEYACLSKSYYSQIASRWC
jgi:hypothetical protein